MKKFGLELWKIFLECLVNPEKKPGVESYEYQMRPTAADCCTTGGDGLGGTGGGGAAAAAGLFLQEDEFEDEATGGPEVLEPGGGGLTGLNLFWILFSLSMLEVSIMSSSSGRTAWKCSLNSATLRSVTAAGLTLMLDTSDWLAEMVSVTGGSRKCADLDRGFSWHKFRNDLANNLLYDTIIVRYSPYLVLWFT